MTINYNPLTDNNLSTKIFDLAKQPIGLNGVYAEAIIANSPVNKYFDDIKITTLTSIKRGDLIIYNSAYWLVISEVATTRHNKYKATVRHIPYAVHMQTGEEQIFTGQYDGVGNPIYETQPTYSDVFLITQDSPNVQLETSGSLTYVNGSIIFITFDSDDSPFIEGFQFQLSNKQWQVTYVDQTKKGLRILQCQKQASETITEPIPLPAPETPVKPEPPAIPTDFVSSVDHATVTLTWSDDGSQNRVYRDNTLLADNLTDNTYTDSTASASTTYTYTVSAFNVNGESDKVQISVTTGSMWDSTGDSTIDSYAARHPELGDPNDENNNNYFEDTFVGYDSIGNPIYGRARRTDIDYNS